MPFAEIAPLALEKVIVGSIVVFTAAGLLGFVVGQLQRRWQITNTAAWIFFFVALLATVALSGFFQVAERFAPLLQPFMGIVALVSVMANAAVWTACFYALFGGKRSNS